MSAKMVSKRDGRSKTGKAYRNKLLLAGFPFYTGLGSTNHRPEDVSYVRVSGVKIEDDLSIPALGSQHIGNEYPWVKQQHELCAKIIDVIISQSENRGKHSTSKPRSLGLC